MEEFGIKKPSPDFIIRLVGTGITPWKVPGRVLARVIEAVQRLVDQEDEADQDIPEQKKIQGSHTTRALRLLDVKSSSAAYYMAAPAGAATIKILKNTAKA